MTSSSHRLFALLLPALLFFAGCNTPFNLGRGSNSQFEGFRALGVPREHVPVGAEWINGVGPNGNGVASDNVITTLSVKSAAFTQDLKQSLDLSVLTHFGLDQNASAVSIINYSDISIHRINDIGALPLVSGQSVLYEYLKAGTISLTFNNNIGANARAQFDERVKELNIRATANYGNTTVISGDNMILAYRVFKLGKPSITRKSNKLKLDDTGQPANIEVLDYEFRFNCTDFIRGVGKVGGIINPDFTPQDWEACTTNYPFDIYITNLQMMNMKGTPYTKDLKIVNSSGKRLQISYRAGNSITTDIIDVSFGYKYPKLPLLFLYDVQEGSRVSIQRVKTPLEMFKNPYAPGW